MEETQDNFYQVVLGDTLQTVDTWGYFEYQTCLYKSDIPRKTQWKVGTREKVNRQILSRDFSCFCGSF